MSELFAKIFEIDKKYQVLVTKDYEEDEDGNDFVLKMRVDLNGVTMSVAAGFSSEKTRDEKFEKYAHEDALNFFKTAEELLN